MRRHDSRSASSCAACKLLKRKCAPNCIFAPYFQSNETHKFAKIHKVFGASNASKILSEVSPELRAEAVRSLVYEAEARLNDPVHGCIGAMAVLQDRMMQLEHDLAVTRAHLACYTSNASVQPPAEPGFRENHVGEASVQFNDGDYDGIRNGIRNSNAAMNSMEEQQPDETLYDPYGYGIFRQQ